MFTVEIGSKTYRPVGTPTPVADKAIQAFIQVLDTVKPNESVRLVDNSGTVLARKTPKSVFISPEWRR